MALVLFILIFMYVPLSVLILNSFNQSNISSWPIETFSFQWWEFAATYQPIRTALLNSVIVAECYTPLYDRWIKTLSNPEETLKKITDRIPLEKRMTTGEEIANMVVFLLSSKSSHTTGQIIHIDGGYVHLDRAALQ